MKKLAVTALVLSMMMAFAACSVNVNTDSDASTADTSAAENAEGETTAAGDDSTSETEAETETETETEAETEDPDAPPEGYQLMELENELFGIKLSYFLPEESRFVKWKAEEQTLNPSNIRYKYFCYINDTDWIDFTVTLSVRSTNGLDWYLKNNEAVPNTEYTGYITGHSYTRDIPMNIYGDDYLDGKVYTSFNINDRYEYLDEDEFNEMTETIQKSIKFTLTGTDQLHTDDGMLRNTRGYFAFPTEITIDDTSVALDFKTSTDDAHVYGEFTNADGEEVKIQEAGYSNDSAWAAYMDSNAKNNPYECTIAGYPAKGYIFQDLSSLNGNYTVQISDDAFYDINVTYKGDLDIAALKAMMEGVEDRDKLNAQMSSYADQFLSAATRLDDAAADADAEAETADGETAEGETEAESETAAE